MDAARWCLEVAHSDLSPSLCSDEGPMPDTADGDTALLEVEHLALTRHTLTYGAMGEALGYWRLFPASAPGRGRLPAWGHARVVESRIEGLAIGTRLFGLWPIATHAQLEGRRSSWGVRETSRHRHGVNPVYNRYATQPPGISTEVLEMRALLHPLFITSFVLAHALAEASWGGADEIVVVSASSKTALGLAHRLKGRVRLVALTSSRHRLWVQGTGWWDRVVTYDRPGDLAGDAHALLVDFSGDADLLARIARLRPPGRVRALKVGGTHGGAIATTGAGDVFSGPGTIEALVRAWGPETFNRRLEEALDAYRADLRPWIEVRHADGPEDLRVAFEDLRRGDVTPATALIARPLHEPCHAHDTKHS